MKLEKIKETIASQAYTQVLTGNIGSFEILIDLIHMQKPVKPKEALQICADLTYNTIMNWDIRCVGKLRELFPQFFPPSLKNGQLIIEMDENSDWIVFSEKNNLTKEELIALMAK